MATIREKLVEAARKAADFNSAAENAPSCILNPARMLLAVLLCACCAQAETRDSEVWLDTGWKFARFWNESWPKDAAPREPLGGCAAPAYDTASWRTVRLPHDWGVEQPFTMDIAGMLGHLPFYGIGWYKRDLTLSGEERARLARGGRLYLDFDGAMSRASVFLNGRDLGMRPFGFISFRVDATDALVPGARQHLAVRLENRLGSGRWYHGGGLYRRVRYTVVPKVHVDHWGVTVRSAVKGRDAEVTASVAVTGGAGTVAGTVYDGARAVAELREGRAVIRDVRLWDTDDPHRYTLAVRVTAPDGTVDACRQAFGVRTVAFRPKEGLFLNGRPIKFQGVCQHSDCGALGTAAYARVFERQVQLLKEMGCNAIRTTHNPASPDLLEACDRLGVMVMDEPFDMWALPKGGPNAYGSYFNAWWKRDLTDFIRRDRNHPCVVLWSIGNEVREQWKPELGLPIATNLVATCHAEDPTRPVTMGNDWIGTWTNGYVQAVDVFGANYKADFYGDFYRMFPDKGLVGTETESLLSTRDAYYFPEDDDWATLARPNYRGFYDWQASSYEKYTIRPCNTAPEVEFKAQRKYPQCYGAFVWTGFDYLGEPSPYEGRFQPYHRASSPAKAAEMRLFRELYGTNATPPRSSYYGIFDLCGFPKDRYWCYKAAWRPDVPVAHILPHWTWPGRAGKVTPVYVYANGDCADLYVNGRHMGRRWADESLRLMWLDVRYEPGTVAVVVWKDGKVWARAERRTAGPAARLDIASDASRLASLQDLAYVTLTLRDARGTVVPEADVDLTFETEGAIEVAGLCNGDPADLTGFQAGHQRTFHGLCQAVVRAREGAEGPGALIVRGGGLTARCAFTVECAHEAARATVDDINPMIGAVTYPESGLRGAENVHGFGKTFPGAATPFGRVQLSPDTITGGDNGPGYSYTHKTIEGFSFFHMSGIGWYGEFGNFQVMPGEVAKSRFDHAEETAEAGYYRVRLPDAGVVAELTASKTAGMIRFTYEKGGKGAFKIDLARRIGELARAKPHGRQTFRRVGAQGFAGEIVCDGRDGGWGRGAGQVNYTVRYKGLCSKGLDELEETGGETNHVVRARFPVRPGESVVLHVAFDFCGEPEMPRGFAFDAMRAAARAAWRDALACVDVKGGTARARRIFATALYHALLDPREVGLGDGFVRRTVFSGWDVYRSEMPLLTLIRPDVVSDTINSMMETVTSGRRKTLPRWDIFGCASGCMIGQPLVPVMAMAYERGIRSFDAEKALRLAEATLAVESNDRARGYKPGSLSATLEYAYADWCCGRLAELMGKGDVAARYFAYAQAYTNCWSRDVGWMRARTADGGWLPWQGREKHGQGCVESNPWQQGWFVPHDPEGLIRLMGGRAKFTAELRRFFAEVPADFRWNDAYNHPNEPCHTLPFLWALSDEPARVGDWTRRIREAAYGDGPFGLCGNEDVGQMSAWYVLTAVGLHPLCPGDGHWYLCPPAFDEATLDVGGGRRFTVRRVSGTAGKARLNGRPLDRPWIATAEIVRGGLLEMR